MQPGSDTPNAPTAPVPAAEPARPPESAPDTSTSPLPREPRPAARSGPSGSLQAVKAKDWTWERARHLLWRAGFGGGPAQIETLVRWGPERSVEHLVNYDPVPAEPDAPDAFDKDIIRPANSEERGAIAKARRMNDEEAISRLRAQRQEAERTDRTQMRQVQHWWLKRMIESPRPLEEKMTLFWHGHFATSFRTIEDSYHMYMQNRLFRRFATGNFGALLGEIIRDPAMIAYLDNNDSRKGKPNENLARELMELFSLGVGNYTEGDIKEGARALTGYTFDDDEFAFRRNNHDTGVKRILGASGPLDGEGFVRQILAQPACAKFMVRKVYRYFVAEPATGEKERDRAVAGVLAQLESTFTGARYELRPLLRRLFLSEHFYSPDIMNDQIKSPAQLVVGAVRSLGTPARDLGVLNDAMNLMGQNLFFPPSVKGWDGGRAWINTATVFIRQNILCFLLTGRTPSGFDPLSKQETFDPAPLLAQMGLARTSPPEEIASGVLRFTLGRDEPQNRDLLTALITSRGTPVTDDTLTRVFLLVTAMPEYQLC